METRSKRRATAVTATLNSTGTVPSSPTPTPSGWSELPPEMLQNIFKNLRFTWNGKDSDKSAMLNCREVHPRWNASMDKVLEEKSLENWKSWQPYNHSTPIQHVFPALQLVSTCKDMRLDFAVCPTAILANQDNCPIPTKSLCLTFSQGRQLIEGHTLIQVENFFTKTGRFLTSIIFHKISTYCSTFSSILQKAPNLKAMTVSNVLFKKEYISTRYKFHPIPELPPLPKLEHLRLAFLKVDRRLFGYGDDDSYKWILGVYALQLTSLETQTILSLCLLLGSSSTYPNMKHMKFYETSGFNFTEPLNLAHFPVLEKVSLIGLQHNMKWKDLVALITMFKGSLTDLNVDFTRNEYNVLECASLTSNEEWELDLPSLTCLKTLGLLYPKGIAENVMFQQFLRMAKNLESLMLFQFRRDFDHLDVKNEDNAEVKEWLESQKYMLLKQCPKLRKVAVFLHSHPLKEQEIYSFKVLSCIIDK